MFCCGFFKYYKILGPYILYFFTLQSKSATEAA